MRIYGSIAIIISFCLPSCSLLIAQDQTNTIARRIVTRIEPKYPEVAKRINIYGTVRISVNIAADGRVKTVRALGGSPLLVKACEDAVIQWRFSPTAAESTETIEIHFKPSN